MNSTRTRHYRLDDENNVIPVPYDEYRANIAADNGHPIASKVASEVVNGLEVSTAFLGVDLAVHDPRKTKLEVFETMVFGPHDFEMLCWRYSTWDEAIVGHAAAVEWVKQKITGDIS